MNVDEVNEIRGNTEREITRLLRNLESVTGCEVVHLETTLTRAVDKPPEIKGVKIALEIRR